MPYVDYYFFEALLWILVIGGVIAAAQIALTRDDAFTAGDRQPKWVWFALTGGSAALAITNYPLFIIIGLVIIGIYYLDVRPQLKDILSGSSNW